MAGNETSPLLLSLLANGGGNAGMTDPAALAAMPRINLAQQMMEQSTSAAPAYPMQALARVVSGFVGNKMYDKALQGLVQAESGVAPDLAKTLDDTDPLKKVLLATHDDGSPDLITRMQGVRAYPQHIQIIGTPKTVGANEDIGFPGANNPSFKNTNPTSELGREIQDFHNIGFPGSTPLQQAMVSDILHRSNPGGVNYSVGANGAPVAAPVANAGTAAGQVEGATAAASGPGKGQGEAAQITAAAPAKASEAAQVATAENPALIARAAGEAKARAPFESGDTVRLIVPKGSRLPDGSVATEDSILEVPITAADRATLLGRLGGPRGGAGAATTHPTAPVTVPAAAGTPAGPAAPQPHIIGNLPSDPTVAPRIGADTKEVATDRENAQKVLPDAANLREVQDLMDRVGRTGWGANEQMEGGRILKALGVSDDQIRQFGALNPSDAQALNKLFTVNSAAAVRNMGAREPGSVIQLFRNAYQNIGTDPDAIKLMTNTQYMNTRWLNDLANAKSDRLTQASQEYQRTGTYKGLQGFNSEFSQSNSPEDYMHAAEAMSGPKYNPWGKITSPEDQTRIISRIPSGSQFIGPDGKMYTRK